MTMTDRINEFLNGQPHAVVGASSNRDKYGNKVLRCYLQHSRPVIPINPRAAELEGEKAYPSLRAAIEESPYSTIHAVSVILPPALGPAIVEEAASLGIRHLWFQPGAESEQSSSLGAELNLSIIDDGSCLLVALGYSDGWAP